MFAFRLLNPGRFLTILMLVATTGPAFSGPISFGTWYQFGFSDIGLPATGCDPADPAGAFCAPSSGTPTTLLDAPEWTATTPRGTFLTVLDAFATEDQFEVFNFGASLGLTSTPTSGSDCGDDPVPCLTDPAASKRVFTLAPGDISIAITPVAGGFGTGFLRVDEVPEPSTALLLVTGVAACLLGRKFRNKKGVQS